MRGETVTEYGPVPRRLRGLRVTVYLVLTAILAAGALAGYLLLKNPADARRDDDIARNVARAEQRMRAFATAWVNEDWTTAARLTDSPEAAASLLESVDRNLDPSAVTITVKDGVAEHTDDAEGPVVVPFTVRMTVPRVGGFEYSSKARLVPASDGPLVAFEPSVIHPELDDGQTLAVAKTRVRGSILDRTGAELVASSLVGDVDEKAGRGVSGLQEQYDDHLRGSGPPYTVAVTDRQSGKAVKPLPQPGSRPGQDIRTTIDPEVQRAAAAALDLAATPASLVAIKPSNGDILAVANRPGGGFNRALVGTYPPGSTFKVVTAAALLEAGLRPSDVLECPRFAWVEGYRFTNQDEFTLPSGSTFQDAFARSCNTAFIEARDRLDNATLTKTAAAFGIGGEWDTGVRTYDGSVPVNTSGIDKAAAMIGQGRNLASPLVMASVAATVKTGRFVQPRLVPDAVDRPHQAPRDLDPEVVRSLRSMMRAVVTEGSGDALRGLPGEPHAKTGTAEYGDERPPRTHAWMIGYQQDPDLAWAVLVEDGSSGGTDAGAIAAEFLRQLTTR